MKAVEEQEVITLEEAARELKKSPSTLRRWVRRGCPTVSLGQAGRGKGSIVRLSDIQRWRAGNAEVSQDERLQFLAICLMDCYKRDEIHRRIGITAREAAGLLAFVYERYYKNLTHEPLDTNNLPPEIKQLCTVWIE